MKIRGFKLAILSAALLSSLTSQPVFAAEKRVEVNIPSEHDACEFTIETAKVGNYDISINPPDSRTDVYKSSIVNDDTCQIIVRDVKEGIWTVYVTTPENLAEESDYIEEGESVSEPSEEVEESIAEAEENEEFIKKETSAGIGKVKVSVRGVSLSNYSVDDIKIAKDIVGLKMFFIDEEFHVTWEDSSVERVAVTVTDSRTKQELGSGTEEGNEFICLIPKATHEITVHVVPSTSTDIERANTQYTVAVPKRPDVDVVFEKVEYTNQDTISVRIDGIGNYGYEFSNNGKEILKDHGDAGNRSYEIPIEENSNYIECFIVDKDGNKFSTAKEVIRDSVEPVLSTDNDYDNLETEEESLRLSGRVDDFDTFYINDSETEVSSDGIFIYDYQLHEGLNTIELKAVDLAGNEAVITAGVTYVIPVEKPFPWIPVITVFLLLSGVTTYLYYQYKTAGNGRYNNMIDENEHGFIMFLADYFRKKLSYPKISLRKKSTIRKPRTAIGTMKAWQADLVILAVFAIMLMALFRYVLTPGLVPSESMDPTLTEGDRVFVNRLAYVFRDPQRGDIVTFRSDEFNELLVKRIIGMPGDKVSFAHGYVYINGIIAYEEYVDENMETNCADEFVVPDGCYFVMGDNRENSYDSRFFQNPYISRNDIMGKLFCKLYNTSFNLKDFFSYII